MHRNRARFLQSVHELSFYGAKTIQRTRGLANKSSKFSSGASPVVKCEGFQKAFGAL